MKIILFLLKISVFLGFCFSCNESNISSTEILKQVEQTVGPAEKKVLNELKPLLLQAAQMKVQSKTGGEELLYRSEKELGSIDFSILPLYELNEAEFIEKPEPENFMNCIHPARNKIFYLGKKKDEICMVLEAKCENNQWTWILNLEGIGYFKTHFSWLPLRLQEADSKSFYLLDAIGSIYVVYFQEGEPVFCNFIGTDMYNKHGFAAMMLDKKNVKDSFQELLK